MFHTYMLRVVLKSMTELLFDCEKLINHYFNTSKVTNMSLQMHLNLMVDKIFYHKNVSIISVTFCVTDI